MKKMNKVLAALLVMGATAVPAMAVEHELSGRFQSFFEANNFVGNGDVATIVPTEDSEDGNWFDQRLRLGYTAKTKDVKLVTKFELDYKFWGNSSYTEGRGSGGAIGADSVNLETKNIYLDWTLPEQKLNAKVGMQGYNDVFSGVIFDADMAGILLTHQCSDNLTSSLGFFRWNDSLDDDVVGDAAQDVLTLTGKYSVSKDLTIGGAYYYLQDKTDTYGNNDAKVHTFGVNAEAVLGAVTVNGFVLGQTGDFAEDVNAKGFAAKLAAKAALSSGTLRFDSLYVAGGEHALYSNVWESGYYDNEMMILSRDKNATTIDSALFYNAAGFNENNGFYEGAIMVSAGYDHNFSQTLTGSVNVGAAWVADNQADEGDLVYDEDSSYVGTEINLEVSKQVTDNLSIVGRGAYVFLGDHFVGDPDDLYAARLLMAYSF